MSVWGRLKLNPTSGAFEQYRDRNPKKLEFNNLGLKSHRGDKEGQVHHSPNQIIFGKTRKMWVIDAARALIASTTPAMRYLIWRDGKHVFLQRGKVTYGDESPFPFTSDERGQIWDCLIHYMQHLGFVKWKGIVHTEWEVQGEFERRYQAQRGKNPTPEKDDDDEPYDGSDIIVEDKYGREIPAKDLHLLLQ